MMPPAHAGGVCFAAGSTALLSGASLRGEAPKPVMSQRSQAWRRPAPMVMIGVRKRS